MHEDEAPIGVEGCGPSMTFELWHRLGPRAEVTQLAVKPLAASAVTMIICS